MIFNITPDNVKDDVKEKIMLKVSLSNWTAWFSRLALISFVRDNRWAFSMKIAAEQHSWCYTGEVEVFSR